MGAFVISKRFNGEYKFVFTSRKGKVIFTSSGYAEKQDCDNAVSFLPNQIEDVVFTKHKTTGAKYYFTLVLGSDIRAVSRKYTTELRVSKGISEIVLYAAKSETLDFSEDTFVFPDDAEIQDLPLV